MHPCRQQNSESGAAPLGSFPGVIGSDRLRHSVRSRSMRRVPTSLLSVIPVWVAALVGAIVVGIAAPGSAFVWLPVVMAAAILLTFVIQLGLSRKEGLVSRIVASLAGALLILVVATVGLWVVVGELPVPA